MPVLFTKLVDIIIAPGILEIKKKKSPSQSKYARTYSQILKTFLSSKKLIIIIQ